MRFLCKNLSVFLAIAFFVFVGYQTFGYYGRHWEFVDCYPVFYIDEYGYYPDGMKAHPQEIFLKKNNLIVPFYQFCIVIVASYVFLFSYVIWDTYWIIQKQKIRALKQRQYRQRLQRIGGRHHGAN